MQFWLGWAGLGARFGFGLASFGLIWLWFGFDLALVWLGLASFGLILLWFALDLARFSSIWLGLA